MPNSCDPLLLNFLPVQAGGGLQNSLSLLATLAEHPEPWGDIQVIVRGGTALESLCVERGCHMFRYEIPPL